MYDEVCTAFDAKIDFILGMAGTGKSTLLAEKVTNEDVVITPTHKAAQVLRNKGIENVVTIHSLLKLIPSSNESAGLKDRDTVLKQLEGVDLSTIKRIYLDEFSMVSVDIFEILLNHLPCIPLTVIGDPSQLNPVDGEAIDPLDYTDNIHTLTTQYRAESPDIVSLFTTYQNAVQDGYRINPDIPLSKNIVEGDLKDFNPDTDTILAFTNKKVLSLNSEVANMYGKSEFTVGDTININNITATITGLNPSSEADLFPGMVVKGTDIDNSKLGEIRASHNKFKVTTYRGYPKLIINIYGRDYIIHYSSNHYEESKLFNMGAKTANDYIRNRWPETKDLYGKAFKDWCSSYRDEYRQVKERQEAWKTYMGHKNDVFDARWPYATTVHKSQGSEFSTVYIAHKNVKTTMRNNQFTMYNRLMYVALSRAQHRVVIIN